MVGEGRGVRVPGWEARLISTIEREDGVAFSWGLHDCLTLVADCCLAVTDVDPMADISPYETEEGAQEVLQGLGYRDVSEALASHFEEIPPALARRGDCGVVELRGVVASVVVMGAISYGRSERGLLKFPTSRVTRAFKVG